MREEKSKSGKVKMRNKALFIGIVAIALAVAAIGATANNNTEASDKVNVPDVPHKINYQGYLTDAAGNPITGDRDMTFKIYYSPTGGAPLWSETQNSVHVEKGLFNVILGSVNPIPGDVFPSGGSRWLETEIEDQTLTPRKEIVSVAYAFKADIVTDNDWDGAGRGAMYPCTITDHVGIGTDDPRGQLDVACPANPESYIRLDPDLRGGCNGVAITLNEHRNRNMLWISAYDRQFGNFIYTEDPGNGNGQGFGIAGGSWMAPFPRFVVNSNETFLGYSIFPGNDMNGAPCTGGDGDGNLYVRGKVGIGTTDPGDYKLNVQGGAGNAIYGETSGAAPSKSAIYGYNGGNGHGVYGKCTFCGCSGVYGENAASGIGVFGKSGINSEGVRGETSGTEGKAIHGINTDGFGGYFEGKGFFSDHLYVGGGAELAADGQHAIWLGGKEQAATNADVRILSQGYGYSFAVGDASGTNNYFTVKNPTGDVYIKGNLNVDGTKKFVQPHPTDPTKEIVYVSLEGPEAGTYIRGTARLANGEAVINLPEHFSLVTSAEGLMVQLTPVGEWLQLYVVKKSTQQIVVREANGKNGQFDYLVQGVRKGYEDHQVIRDKE